MKFSPCAALSLKSEAKRLRRQVVAGNTLIIVLVALVAMSLAGVAMVRAIDSGILITGNLAFRQSTLHGGDLAIETARTWLVANAGSKLENEMATATFYHPAADSADWSWDSNPNSGSPSSLVDPIGNQVDFFIERLCRKPGANGPSNNCISGAATGRTDDTGNSQSAGAKVLKGSTYLYYRISVRITGPRNSVSYVQSIVEL